MLHGSNFDPELLYGRSDFGESETRLRRINSLEGLVPLDLGRVVTPVQLVADGTLPGMGQTRLRFFSFQGSQGGLGTGFWFKCNRDDGVLIDQIEVVLGVAGVVSCRYLGASDADPVAIANGGGVTVDRAPTGAEASPLLRNAVADASAITALNLLYTSQTNLPIGRHLILARPFFLDFGAKFSVGGSQATGIGVVGRTF